MPVLTPPKAPKPPKLPSVTKAPTRVEVRPPDVRRHARLPTGPRMYRNAMRAQRVDFPGEPPAEFLAGEYHGSASEWPIYAALWKIFSSQPNDGYRQAPFYGDHEGQWVYQSWQLGGRSIAGGAVADFEIRAGRRGPSLFIRVQSYRFHLTAGPEVVSYDDVQKEHLSEYGSVVDVFEQDYLGLDAQSLIVYVKRQLGMIQTPDPIRAGTVRRT